MSGQRLIEGDVIDEKDNRIAVLEAELDELRDELRTTKAAVRVEKGEAQRSVAMLRKNLEPLYTALKAVFGELEVIGGGDVAPSGASGNARVSAVWESWKGRLSPACGRVIDALLIHGALSSKQLCVAAKMGMSTLLGGTGVLAKLNKAGLLDKNGGKFSLKAL